MTTARWMVAAVLAIGALGAPSRTDTASAVSAFVSAPVCMPGRDAAALDTMFFAEPGGVIGADYQRAFALPDGRVFWTFQDAAVRIGGGEIAIVHNIAVLQDETCITVHYGGSRADPRSLFFADRTERFRRWFWPMDATLAADGTVAVFVAEMEERGDDYLTHTVPVGTWMASFDPTTDAVVDERRAANGSADLYGWSVTSDDEWTYLYAQCYRQFGFDESSFVAAFDRSCATEVTVARIPRGQVSMPPAYWDGATWQPDPGRAVAIIDERDRRINANQFEWTGDGFVSVNLEGDWWGDTILLSRSEHPAGPFVEYQRVPAPLKCDPAECNSFFASWVPGAAANRPLERFVVSVAHNRWDGVVTSVYRPTYLHVKAPRHLSAGSAIANPQPSAIASALTARDACLRSTRIVPRVAACSGSGAVGSRGTLKIILVPPPAATASASTVPPRSVANWRVIESPSPLPELRPSVSGMLPENGSKIVFIRSGLIPPPVSVTEKVQMASSPAGHVQASVIRPTEVNLTALETKLARIC